MKTPQQIINDAEERMNNSEVEYDTKDIKVIIKERDESFERSFCWDEIFGKNSLSLSNIKDHYHQTIHLLLNALIEREEEKPDGYDMMSGKVSEYELEGYHKAKQETITYLKDLINQHK